MINLNRSLNLKSESEYLTQNLNPIKTIQTFAQFVNLEVFNTEIFQKSNKFQEYQPHLKKIIGLQGAHRQMIGPKKTNKRKLQLDPLKSTNYEIYTNSQTATPNLSLYSQVTEKLTADSQTYKKFMSTQVSPSQTSSRLNKQQIQRPFPAENLQIQLSGLEIIQNQIKKNRSKSNYIEGKNYIPMNKKRNKELKSLIEISNKQIINSRTNEVVIAITQNQNRKISPQHLKESLSVFDNIFIIFMDKYQIDEKSLPHIDPQLPNIQLQFSQFLLLCESTNRFSPHLINSFCRNNQLIDTILCKQKSLRLQVLVDDVLFFRLPNLIAQYRFLQQVDHQVLKAIARMMSNIYQQDTIHYNEQNFYWADFVRFKKFYFNHYSSLFFSEGLWCREDSVIFILSVIEAGKKTTVSITSLEQIFQPEILSKMINLDQKTINKPDLLRHILKSLDEKDLFNIVQSLLKQK